MVTQRKLGAIKVVNNGEEKVRVHMNVVPREKALETQIVEQRINSEV